MSVLAAVDDDAVVNELTGIPMTRISDVARRFALEMLRCNKRRILEASRT